MSDPELSLFGITAQPPPMCRHVVLVLFILFYLLLTECYQNGNVSPFCKNYSHLQFDIIYIINGWQNIYLTVTIILIYFLIMRFDMITFCSNLVICKLMKIIYEKVTLKIEKEYHKQRKFIYPLTKSQNRFKYVTNTTDPFHAWNCTDSTLQK